MERSAYLEGTQGSSSEIVDDGLALLFLPERQVLLEELNDGLGISEGLLVDLIDLLEGIRESLLAELAGNLVVVHDLIIEDRVVERETESNRVAGVETLGEILSSLVALVGASLDLLELVALGGLGNISVVVTDHLLEEGLGLVVLSELHAVVLDDVHDADALLVELVLNLVLVHLQGVVEFGILGVLLNGTDGADGTTLGTDEVLEANREEVALVDGEVLIVLGLDGLLEELDHVLKSLSLLGNSSEENFFFHL
jgi:hypothetical protein